MNADNTPQRWKVNGEDQTWKEEPNRVAIPLKRGLYSFSHLTERNLWYFSLNEL